MAENGPAFEKRWADRESKLKECDGFVAFSMMRRDTGGKGHGVVPFDENSEPTYTSVTIWKDRASFDAWRKGTAFKKVHGAKPPSEQTSATDKGAEETEAAAPKPPSLLELPPKMRIQSNWLFKPRTILVKAKRKTSSPVKW